MNQTAKEGPAHTLFRLGVFVIDAVGSIADCASQTPESVIGVRCSLRG
jgi:hypothetical protein